MKWLMALVVGLVVGIGGPITTALADGAGQPASGSGLNTSFTPTEVRTADGNTFIEATITGFLRGTFAGSYVETLREIIHPDGTANVHATATFTGTAGDCGQGTVHFNIEGQGAGVIQGRAETIRQGSATVPVHANLDFVAFPDGTLTYAGSYTCP